MTLLRKHTDDLQILELVRGEMQVVTNSFASARNLLELALLCFAIQIGLSLYARRCLIKLRTNPVNLRSDESERSQSSP